MKKKSLSILLKVVMIFSLFTTMSMFAYAGTTAEETNADASKIVSELNTGIESGITPKDGDAKITTLYFGQSSRKATEYSFYTNHEKTENYNDGLGKTWSVEWNEKAALPQLNLGNGTKVFNTGYAIQICTPCIINVTGVDTLGNGIVINENCDVTFTGSGVLYISSKKVNALTVKSKATVNGPTINCNSSAKKGKDVDFGKNGMIVLKDGNVNNKAGKSYYAGNDLFLAKRTGSDYALYADAKYNFGYAVGEGSAWSVSDTEYNNVKYASLMLNGALNKNIVLKQPATDEYVAVLNVNGINTKVGGFDASEGTLTVQSSDLKKITVTGDIKAQNLYLTECAGLTVNMINGSLVEKKGVKNELMICTTDAAKRIKVIIQNGGIDFPDSTVALMNADVVIGKNSLNKAAEIGIKAFRLTVDASRLTIKDVATGVLLYDTVADENIARMSLHNKSAVNINGKAVGVKGTAGADSSIYVADAYSTIAVAGGIKAVESVEFTPLPENKIVKSTVGKVVVYKKNATTGSSDYYYAGTVIPAKGLTLGVNYNSSIANQIKTVINQKTTVQSMIKDHLLKFISLN